MKNLNSDDIFIILFVSIKAGGMLGILLFLFQLFSEIIPNITEVSSMLMIIPITVICFIIGTTYKILSKKQVENLKLDKKLAEEELQKKEWEETKKSDKLLYLNSINEIKSKFNKYQEVLLLGREFERILSEMESKIIKIDKKEKTNYVQQFVKISNFINKKNKKILTTYSQLVNTKEKVNYNGVEFEADKHPYLELQELPKKVKKLENEIILYQEIIFHSINMILALINNKMFIFYQIYEIFDGLGVFENNWQNKVSDDLKNINKKLDQIDRNIQQGFEYLTYTIDNSFTELQKNIIEELQNINSNIVINNFLTAVQTRKMYQIRRDTKSINNKN
jgi:hypothetical protein